MLCASHSVIRQRSFLLCILLCIPSALCHSSSFQSTSSNAPAFAWSRLYQVPIGLEEVAGHIAGFGDFNNDKFTDVVIVSDDDVSVDIYLWDHANWIYDPVTWLRLTGDLKIRSVVAGDFNYDGWLDLLVMGDGYLHLYLREPKKWSAKKVLEPALDEVLVMDHNSDLHLDLFGTLASTGERSYWVNQGDAEVTFKVVRQQTIDDLPVDFTCAALPKLRIPHSNAFIDLNGDCLADFVVTSAPSSCVFPDDLKGSGPGGSIEIWTNKKHRFKLDKVITIPSGTGQITFADYDGDGTVDLLAPVCFPLESCDTISAFHVLYNQQMPLCSSAKSSTKGLGALLCRREDQLCEADQNWKMESLLSEPNQNHVVVDLKTYWPNARLQRPVPGLPITIRVGDFNSDGYPDLLVPTTDSVTGRIFMTLWQNVPCSVKTCPPGATESQRRTFQPFTSGVDDLVNIDNAYAATFMDIDEDGVLDILVLSGGLPMKTAGSQTQIAASSSRTHITAVFNNFHNDAFFIKALGLNGVCWEWCAMQKFPDPKPYGVNMPGVTFKFLVTSLEGEKRVRQGGQLSQSAYLALQTPYNIFGLGRSSNYIEELYMGVPVRHPQHWNKWVCIIPNSQLVAIPYDESRPHTWQLELYINPSSKVLWVGLALLIVFAILGGVIFYLQWKEKKEDEKEMRESAHLFSFDAL